MNNNLEKVEEFAKNFNVPIYNSLEEVPVERKILRLKMHFEELTELAEALGLQGTLMGFAINYTKNSIVDDEYELRDLDSEFFENFDTYRILKSEVLDALGDIEYINNGSVLEFGLKKCYNEAFSDIHESNMSKLCTSESEAAQTVLEYEKYGTETYFKQNSEGKFVVYRKLDDKILKSINYKPFDSKKYFK